MRHGSEEMEDLAPWGPRRHRRSRGPWMFPMGGSWPGGGPRARRGDVRAAILALLADGSMHGYQIMQELESRTGGAWRPSPGSIYPTLQLLEDEGLVSSSEVEGKRVFSLTEAGRQHVQEHGPDVPPWEDMGEDGGGIQRQLHRGLRQFAVALMQVAQSGSPEHAEAALEILRDARKRLYSMLAEAD